MLIFYGFCIIGLTGGALWWLNLRDQTLSANATSTAIAHATEQAQFEFIDPFEDTSVHWHVGKFKNTDDWDGSLEIKEGAYIWTVDKVRRPFLEYAGFSQPFPIKDFDAYLDTRVLGGTAGNSCSGLVFRRSFQGWAHGAYVFFLCNDSTFDILYHDQGGWERISGRRFNEAILPSYWNRIEISARGGDFKFSINHEVVYELTDDRQAEGALGLLIQVCDTTPTVVWFDNFGFQSR